MKINPTLGFIILAIIIFGSIYLSQAVNIWFILGILPPVVVSIIYKYIKEKDI